MFVSCWSAKGGSGTTVISVALALVMARSGEVLLVDLAGDVPGALGLAEPESPGLTGWLAAGDDVGVDALARLEAPGRPGLSALPRGAGPLPEAPARFERLAVHLAEQDRSVVVDCGVLPRVASGGAAGVELVAGAAQQSLLVTRACYLGLRRAVNLRLRPSGIVLITEPGRALNRLDVEQIVGVPVQAEVALDPAVARAVDAGLLGARLPRTLERALRRAA